MSEFNELPTEEPSKSEKKNSFGTNPLDFSEDPIGQHKIFNVWYQQGDDDYAFRIYTSNGIDHMVYLYRGDDQVGRVTLSDDDTEITGFDVGDESVAKEVLSTKEDFPFKSLLESKLDGEKYGAVEKEHSFEISPDELEAFENLGRDTIQNVRFVTVPKELIGHIIGKDRPTKAFHTTKKIGGRLIDTSDMWNKTFGWYLGNLGEMDKAQNYAKQVMDPETVVIDDSLRDTLDGKRLGYHEIIHEIFTRARDGGDEKVKKVADAMMSAFNAIPVNLRKNFQRTLLSSGYKPEKVPEEFWTYYLSTRAFPSDEPNDVESDVLRLGEAPSIKEITQKMPFLTEEFARSQIVSKAQQAKRLIAEGDKSS